MLEPDAIYLNEDSQSAVTKTALVGAPELVVEVLSPVTARRDRREKFDLYEQYGVKECWLVDPESEFVEVYTLKDSTFARLGVFRPDETFQSVVLSAAIDCEPIFE